MAPTGVLASPPANPNKRSSSNSSTEHKKSILDQINFEAVKEVDLTVTAGLQRLRKLHLAVDTCIQKLLSFCVSDWLEVTNLHETIAPIRDFSGKLKIALRLLTEFGLGALVNSTQHPNGEMLMDALIVEVEPLLESYYKIKICLLHLDGNNWAVPLSRSSSTDKFFATLNAIMILSQRIPELCRLFNEVIEKHAKDLFHPDPQDKVLAEEVKPEEGISTKPKIAIDTNTKRELADRRQHARDNLNLAPRIPPKPSLPSQRRSMAGVMEPPESPRSVNLGSRGFRYIERLVTDYVPDNTKQKKYASDPSTPSYKEEQQKMIWGGSCPHLLDCNAATTLCGAETESNSHPLTKSVIEEESSESKQNSEKIYKYYPSDSNIISPVLTPINRRSTSLPKDNTNSKNVFDFDETNKQRVGLCPLDHRDIEALEFFCRQVESQVMLLREAMKNLTESVENREEPAIFVSHSKFVILTAHKVVHGGQEISERLINTNIKSKLKDGSSHLTLCIRGVVSATKTAALEFPEPGAMMEMISSVLAIGDAVRILHTECRRALDA